VITEDLITKLVKTTSEAAYASSLWKGKGDKNSADQAAVDKMRFHLNKIDMRGKVVIGEGEMDEAPMLYIGEKIGTGKGYEFDIAVDPLEGTNLTAKNLPNALSVLALSNKNNLLHAPDIYMEKIAVGPGLEEGIIDLDYGTKKNILNLANFKKKKPNQITACLLKRDRHNQIVKDLNELGVNIKFISDGDVSGVIYVGYPTYNVDIYLGIGGAPEGVLAAAAIKCLEGQFQGRLVIENKDQQKKCEKLGIENTKKKYSIKNLVTDDVVFVATGVTDGDLVSGIKVLDNKIYQSETLVLHLNSKTNKKIVNKFNL